MCLSDNEKIKQSRMVIDDTEYTHIAYKKIIEDNPLLCIKAKNKAQVLGNKINKTDLLRYHIKKRYNQLKDTLQRNEKL